jgi:ATP-dependent protease ClpP protease subunit
MGSAEDSHEVGVDHVIRNLLHLDGTSGDIELWINTPGGEVVEMWALYDIIQTLNNKVSAVAFGEVASAGCLILAGATHWDAQTRAAWYEREMNRWCSAMGEHTNETKTWWKNKTKQGELWLDAEEMVTHGIVDEIWGEEEDA